jgi:Leucine-rich repeat (LRR) protein
MTTDPTSPRRKWHLQRWLLLLAAGFLAYGGWTTYAFRAALKEARALGWYVEYTDPSEEIRKNWKAAFEKETWLDGVTGVEILTSEAFEQHLAIVHRLNPKSLQIDNAATLRDLSAFHPLTRLQGVGVIGCTGLTNVDALKNLSALQQVVLSGGTGLTNVDALKNLSALQLVVLDGCTGLTNVDALKNLSALQTVSLTGCTGLTNVDALTNLSALQLVVLDGCTGLTNVDALKSLSALQQVYLTDCTGLTPESVAALRAVLPSAQISDP